MVLLFVGVALLIQQVLQVVHHPLARELLVQLVDIDRLVESLLDVVVLVLHVKILLLLVTPLPLGVLLNLHVAKYTVLHQLSPHLLLLALLLVEQFVLPVGLHLGQSVQFLLVLSLLLLCLELPHHLILHLVFLE